ncbi:MAG: DNA adenine methylase [Nitrososphaerota archaeon]|nr:DNA adenine methylase [Nitrososphaerota archaeon]
MVVAKSFVKWAGGKSQLLVDIQKKYPVELGRGIVRYCEPFVGGGAVLFDVLSRYKIDEVLINDINKELVNAYVQIKLYADELIGELGVFQDMFWNMTREERKIYYYNKRERFNYLKINNDEKINLEKATLFIFLNRTCFNGLFRVNHKGQFNVPLGSYKKPLICDTPNIKNISTLLQNVTIRCGDYKNCSTFIDRNTFVYLDPPYRPITQTSNFTAYTKTPFDDKKQIELSKFVNKIHQVGAKVIISNSDPKNNNMHDDFFDKLYQPYHIKRITAKRMINCQAENRGNISELLISNY